MASSTDRPLHLYQFSQFNLHVRSTKTSLLSKPKNVGAEHKQLSFDYDMGVLINPIIIYIFCLKHKIYQLSNRYLNLHSNYYKTNTEPI
jgi:hypothetical protein